MTPQFYRKHICPKDKLSLPLFELDILEVRGKYEVGYQVFWTAKNITDCKLQSKIWAKQQNIKILSIKAVKENWKDIPEERSI